MKISILGAGVAGLSAAIALAKKGIQTEIYERSVEVSHLGAGIVCWPNAMFVLDALGLKDEIISNGFQPAKMVRYSSQGDFLGALDIRQLNLMMNYPSVAIFRRDLMRILFEKVQKLKIPVKFDHTVEQIKLAANGRAQVFFENGKKIMPDWVLGADGRMHSVARKFVLGDASPVFQKFINWVGIFEDDELDFLTPNIQDYWGVGKRFGIVPTAKNKAYWAGAIQVDAISPVNPNIYQNELLDLFSDWPDPVKKIIQKTPNKSIHKIYIHDHNPSETWARENVLLIGDSAHAPLPTSGQGACQALEDAWHLAELLSESGQFSQDVCHSFVEKRYQKTANIIYGARDFARSLFNTNVDFCDNRNRQSKQIDFSAMAQGMAHAWGAELPIQPLSS